jgi:hypothetical protein
VLCELETHQTNVCASSHLVKMFETPCPDSDSLLVTAHRGILQVVTSHVVSIAVQGSVGTGYSQDTDPVFSQHDKPARTGSGRDRARTTFRSIAFSLLILESPKQGSTPFFFFILNYIILKLFFLKRSRGSSVSIVSDYGLDDGGSIPDRGRGFFF